LLLLFQAVRLKRQLRRGLAMGHQVNPYLVFALAVGLCAFLRADTVVMKSGQTIDGKIISEDDRAIELEVEYGTMRVPRSRILRIEEDTPEKIKEREDKAAEQQELADKMKEEGKVLYKGKWVTEQEKKAAEDKATAAKKKKEKERADAKKKADEEAKRKAEEDKKLAQQQQNQQNQGYNNPQDRWRDQHQSWRDNNLDPNSMYGSGSSRRGSSSNYSGGYGGGGYNNYRNQGY